MNRSPTQFRYLDSGQENADQDERDQQRDDQVESFSSKHSHYFLRS